jgi:hypothetical protein
MNWASQCSCPIRCIWWLLGSLQRILGHYFNVFFYILSIPPLIIVVQSDSILHVQTLNVVK